MGLTFDKLLVILVIALIILGPERLPYYAQKLGELVKGLKKMADGAKDRVKDEMGPEFEDIDWAQLDPRQYDPRRIIRDALKDEEEDTPAARRAKAAAAARERRRQAAARANKPATVPEGASAMGVLSTGTDAGARIEQAAEPVTESEAVPAGEAADTVAANTDTDTVTETPPVVADDSLTFHFDEEAT